ncbi:MAG: 30S ribosome-binding factor RbfA [Chloroflexi bacterium]|nr:30S ribosome-binding factor RbfA [Chloroflexota bacterium]
MTRRQERVNGLLRQELSSLLAKELKDPRLSLLVTITRVDASVDLRHARVFVSVLGSAEEQRSAIATLQAAAGFLHHQLKERLSLRYIPSLSFTLDQSLERGARMLQMLDALSSSQEPAP